MRHLDEISAEGISTAEAIARRAFLGVELLAKKEAEGVIPFAAMKLAVEVLFSTCMPFMDSDSRRVALAALTELEKQQEVYNELGL